MILVFECLGVFNQLHITAQSGRSTLVVLCHSHWFPKRGILILISEAVETKRTHTLYLYRQLLSQPFLVYVFLVSTQVFLVSHIAFTTLVRFIALLRLASTFPDPVLISVPVPVPVPVPISVTDLVSVPAPVLVPILCSSTGLHPRSRFRSRSHPVPAPVPVSILRFFACLHPRSRSRSVLDLAPLPSPSPFTSLFSPPTPFLSPFPPQTPIPAPTPIPPPTLFASTRPLDPVTPSVECACTDTGRFRRSCQVAASATPCLQR